MPVISDVLTIGHSTYGWDQFAALLRKVGATAIADVRSAPYSRYNPHFCREDLHTRLKAEGLAYVFLGRELGGRPSHPSLFTDGIADYEKMATTESFRAGLDRIIEGATRYRITLMCSEQEPLDCHRCLLVARRLVERGASVGHVLPSGSIEAHQSTEERLLALTGIRTEDLFSAPAERLAAAYRNQGFRVAFSEPSPELLQASHPK